MLRSNRISFADVLAVLPARSFTPPPAWIEARDLLNDL